MLICYIPLYDFLSRVAIAVHGPLEVGAHEIPADLGLLSSGVYVARLSIAGKESVESARFNITQ